MTKRLVIVQPHMPTYRVAFFEELRQALGEQGIECIVAAGRPKGAAADRGDSVQPDWLISIDRKVLSVGKRSIKLGINPRPWDDADAVILGLEGSAFPVYQALWARFRTGIRVGLWGHVRPYVAPGNKADLWLEKLQMHLADHIFAYTPGGRKYAVAAGVNKSKLTTVMNTMDTTALEKAHRSTTVDDVSKFALKLNIDPEKTLCFIGGVDTSKRIEFLVDALDHVWEQDRSVRLLVGGDGPQKILLQKAFARGQAINLGYLDTRRKALVLSASRYVAMPGRIGLVAVDALVMQRPIVTTTWAFHAPEAEYLEEGLTRLSSADDPRSYAEVLLKALRSSPASPRNSDWKYPTLDEMVSNFSQGVISMLSDNSRKSLPANGLDNGV